MMTDIFPNGVQSAGMNTFYLLTTPPADPTEPTLAEINATSTIDITCYIPSNAFTATLDQATEDDTRWCDKTARQEFGVPSINLDAIRHIVNPQGTGAETGNLLLGSLLPDSNYYLAWRLGVDHNTAPAAGQKIVGFDLTTGAAFTPAITSGKYLREVKVSLTARTDLDGVAIPAA